MTLPLTKQQIQKYEDDMLKVIKDNNLFVISDIFAFYTGCSRQTFYNHELEKSEAIKQALDDNKRKTCQSLKNKWFKSENSTLQIALFKTICSDEDRKAVAMGYMDITSAGQKLNTIQLIDANETQDKEATEDAK